MPVFQVHIDDGRVLHIEADDAPAAAAVAEHYVANEGKSAPLSAQRLGEAVKSAWDSPTPGGPLALVKALHSGVMGGAQLTKDAVEGKTNLSSPEGIGRATQSVVDLMGTPLTGGATTAAMMLAARARAKAGIVPPTPEPAPPPSALSPHPPREPSGGPSGATAATDNESSPLASLGGALLNLVPMVRSAREVGGAAKRVFDQYTSKPPQAAPEASAAGPRPVPLSPRRIEGYPEEPGAPWGPRDPDAAVPVNDIVSSLRVLNRIQKNQDKQTTMEAMPQIKRLAMQAKAEQAGAPAAQPPMAPQAPPPEAMAAPQAPNTDSTQALARGMQAVAKMRAQSEALQGKPPQAPVAAPPQPMPQQPPPPPVQQQPAPMAAPVAPQQPASGAPPGLVAEALARARATQAPPSAAVNGAVADPFEIPGFLQRPMPPQPPPVAAIKALTKANGKVTVERTPAPSPQGDLLAKLAEVKGRDPATAYSQDNARQIDLMNHTSEGMGAEDAAYHITDMMKELGKTVRNRDDHAAYLAPFIKNQDKLAAEVSRVTGIPIEKLVPHLRAIGTHGPDAVRSFRERLQEFEPERASRIAEVLSDQRIKQIWRKK